MVINGNIIPLTSTAETAVSEASSYRNVPGKSQRAFYVTLNSELVSHPSCGLIPVLNS